MADDEGGQPSDRAAIDVLRHQNEAAVTTSQELP
jgi:hypothetical protein